MVSNIIVDNASSIKQRNPNSSLFSLKYIYDLIGFSEKLLKQHEVDGH